MSNFRQEKLLREKRKERSFGFLSRLLLLLFFAALAATIMSVRCCSLQELPFLISEKIIEVTALYEVLFTKRVVIVDNNLTNWRENSLKFLDYLILNVPNNNKSTMIQNLSLVVALLKMTNHDKFRK